MNDQPLSKEVLHQASQCYGIKYEELTYLGGFENFVYAYQKDNQEYVLRIGLDSHMPFDLVQAEIDWLLYLAEGKVPVVKPMPSENSLFVEKLTLENSNFNIVSFERVEGQHLDFQNPQSWDKEIIKQWGQIVGRMHALSKNYTPRSTKRYHFKPLEDKERLKYKDKEIVERMTQIFQDLEKFPKTKDSYGLIHSDLHPGNFFINNNKITGLFDFDRCCYKWFIADIAIALYYPLYLSPLRQNPKAQKEFISYFLPLFWEGYERENQLEAFWKGTLNTFIKVRDAILYMYFPTDRDQKPLEVFKSRIMGKEPYIDIEY
ncbi:MAG: phosphotransferase enzyme family protein [Candidatus Hodarchaeota archaeon]